MSQNNKKIYIDKELKHMTDMISKMSIFKYLEPKFLHSEFEKNYRSMQNISGKSKNIIPFKKKITL